MAPLSERPRWAALLEQVTGTQPRGSCVCPCVCEQPPALSRCCMSESGTRPPGPRRPPPRRAQAARGPDGRSVLQRMRGAWPGQRGAVPGPPAAYKPRPRVAALLVTAAHRRRTRFFPSRLRVCGADGTEGRGPGAGAAPLSQNSSESHSRQHLRLDETKSGPNVRFFWTHLLYKETSSTALNGELALARVRPWLLNVCGFHRLSVPAAWGPARARPPSPAPQGLAHHEPSASTSGARGAERWTQQCHPRAPSTHGPPSTWASGDAAAMPPEATCGPRPGSVIVHFQALSFLLSGFFMLKHMLCSRRTCGSDQSHEVRS